MTPEEEAHKIHSDNCPVCKSRIETEKTGKKATSFLSDWDTKSFVKNLLSTAIMGALLLLAFNTGQLQTYYNIDYYNKVVCGPDYKMFSNEPTDDLGRLFNLGSFVKPEAKTINEEGNFSYPIQ